MVDVLKKKPLDSLVDKIAQAKHPVFTTPPTDPHFSVYLKDAINKGIVPPDYSPPGESKTQRDLRIGMERGLPKREITKPPNIIGGALNIAQKYVAEPFAATLTAPLYGADKGWSLKDALNKGIVPVVLPGSPEMAKYQAWKDPMLDIGPIHIGVKGVVESIPYMAIPSAGQAMGALKGVQGAGMLAKGARAAGQALKPVAAAEALPGKAIGGAVSKVAEKFPKKIPSTSLGMPQGVTVRAESAGTQTATIGAAATPEERLTNLIRESAVPARAETELLKHKEMQQRVARLGAAQQSMQGKGLPGFFAEKSTLGGEMPKAQFTPVFEKLTPEDQVYLLDKPLKFWNEQAIKGEINPRYVPLTVNSTKEALYKLVVEGVIPQEKELELLLQCYGEPLIKAILDKRTLGQKGFAALMDITGLPRALQSSWDYSMPFRQAAVLTASNPTLSLPAMVDMVRASLPMPFKKWQGQVGEHWATRMNKLLWSRPNAQLYQQAGLELPSMGKYASLVGREENFQTRLANVIPGIKQSQQAAITYLNQLRADKFDQIITKWEKEVYNYTAEDIKNLGQYINIATGRGELGSFKKITPFLNIMFYSSRLVASRVELPYILVKATPAVRKEIAKDLVKSAGILLGDLAILKLTGAADIQLNPRSSDFGKIRVGDTRLDLMGGYQQYMRLIVQVAGSLGQANMRTTARTQYGQATQFISGWDALTRFGRSKLAPVPGFLTDLMDGKNYIGQELDANKATVAREAWSRFMPFFVQDMTDAIKQEGLIGGLVTAPEILGGGAQTYKVSSYTLKTTLQEKLANQMYDKTYAQLDDKQKTAISNNAEMKKLNAQIRAEEGKTTTTKKPTGTGIYIPDYLK